MNALWLRGLLRQRPLRLWGSVLGVAITTLFLALLLGLVAAGQAKMTARAAASVVVDWQVLLGQGTAPAEAEAALHRALPASRALRVGYAGVRGFEAQGGGTVQTTGAGQVLGLPDGYAAQFPGVLRPLVGRSSGVLLAQQTAANLHAAPGDRITLLRYGAPPLTVTVDGIVDLPQADALFQAVGAPRGLAPQAPPDNVLLLPRALWDAAFAPQRFSRPDTVREQLHVRLGQTLPGDPGQAFGTVGTLARNLEARLAGGAVVGNTLGARLDGARESALYAEALFLFLGVPGALLAGALTLFVAASSATERAGETALLRLRGASERQVLGLLALEAGAVAMLGTMLGLALATLLAPALVGVSLGGSALLVPALVGLALALLAVALPAVQALRGIRVMVQRRRLGHRGAPLWQRLYLDLLLLAVAGAVFVRSALGGYQLVLAPEGVAQASFQAEAFVAPLLFWLGGTLLALRLLGVLLRRKLLERILRPLAGRLAPIVAAALERQGDALRRGAALVALAVSFALSTAIFNATYDDQARTDAFLTNGADVTVTGSARAPVGSQLAALRRLSGVGAAQPLMHRFAYVGADLQDLFGVDASGFNTVSRLADSYFVNQTARGALETLKGRPDAVFVSQETVNDYGLSLGDPLRLRLLDARSHRYEAVPFTFVGVVREFPTAPKDSFLVANAAYLARMTANPASEVALLRVSGDPSAVVQAARAMTRGLPGVTVSDLSAVRSQIASGLTAVNLAGLSRIELALAATLLAAASGLVLALGLSERRRGFTVLAALGASRAQRRAFLNGEALLGVGMGALLGVVVGLGVSLSLVRLLQGVFDPPPEHLVLPLPYLLALLLSSLASTALALGWALRASEKRIPEVLRVG